MKIAPVIRLIVTAFVVTLLSPFSATTPAQANGTITKTITVKGYDGALLSGATVLVEVYYPSGDIEFLTTTTNSSGVAVITAPNTAAHLGLAAAPAESDTQNAILSYRDIKSEITTNTSQSIAVTFKRASMRISLKTPNGELAERGIMFQYPDSNGGGFNYSLTPRTGAFGIALAPNLSPTSKYVLAPLIYQADVYTNKSLFSWRYGLKASGMAGSQTYAVYTDQSLTTQINPNSSGVYELEVKTGNINGQLKKTDGTNLSLPEGVNASVSIIKLNSDGSYDGSADWKNKGGAGTHIVYEDGSFPGFIGGGIAGKYEVNVRINGSLTIPSFRSYIYQDSSGKFSTTEGSGFTSAPYTLNLTVPTSPNLAIETVLPGTSTIDTTTSIEFEGVSPTVGNGYFNLFGTGKVSAVMPNGQFKLRVTSEQTNDNYAANEYVVTISGGAVASLTLGGQAVSASSGIYQLSSKSPNVFLKLSDSATGVALSKFWVQIQLNTSGKPGDWVAGADSRNGQTRLALAEGSYFARITPRDAGYGDVDFAFTVASNGQATFSGITAVNGVHTLPIKEANLKLQFLLGGQPSEKAFIEFCQGTSETEFNSCSGTGLNQSGQGYSNLSTGTHYIVVRPRSSELANKTYTATVSAQGEVSITGATKVDGHWQVSGQTPNVKFKVSHPNTNELVTSGWIGIQRVSSDGSHMYWLPNVDLFAEEPGLASAYVADGNYILKVNPGGDSSVEGLAAKRYVMTVVAGVATISLGGTTVSKDNQLWLLSLANSNLNIKLTTPTGGVLNDSWFDLCEDLGYGPNKTGNCTGQGVNQEGEGSLNVEPGNYYIRVNPGSSQPFASKIYALTVSSDGAATITGSTKSGDIWPLAAAAPNFSGKILPPTGDTLTVANGQGFDIQLQRWDSNKNYWEYIGNQWKNTADFAFKISAAGKYRVTINPRGFSQYTNTASSPVWVNGSNQISTSEGGTYASSLTNFNIRVKTPNVLIDFIDPRDNSAIKFGWITAFSVDPVNNNQLWVGNSDISSENPGKAGFNFDDGTYRLEVNPQSGSSTISGLTRKQYKVVVSSSGSSIVMTGWTNTTEVAKVNSRFQVKAGSANITGRVVDSAGNPLENIPNACTNINVQKLNSSGNWDWTDNWYNPDRDGYFNINMEEPGTYRLRIEPSGRQNVTISFSEQFTITSENAGTFEKKFDSIKLSAPDLLLSVYQGESPTAIQYLGVEIRKNNQWLDWVNTGSNGVAGLSFTDAGTYQLVLYPNQEQTQNGFTRATYEVVVTKDSSGAKTATVTPKTGATKVGTLNKLKLGTAALSGHLRLPSPSETSVAYATIVPIASNGQELWEYASNTSTSGKWAISLPAGTYRLQARAPYGIGSYGNGDRVGTVTIASDGSATLSGDLNGQDPLNLTLRLKNPTWSGTVLAPGSSTDPIPNAWLCLVLAGNWNCVQANQQGQWALSAPSGFTEFDATSELRIEDVQNRLYPTLSVRGASAVSTSLGGLTATGLTHRMPAANVEITITAGSQVASGIWVNLEEVGANWLGSNMTDAQGKAKFYIDPSKLSTTQLRVRAEINGNPKYSGSYASSSKTFTGSGSAITETLGLAVPNFKAMLNEPTVGGVAGAVVPFSWVELLRENGQGWDEWISGTSTDSQGQFAFFAPTINNAETKYILRVNPPWNNTSTSSSQEYVATVNSGGSVTGVVVRSKPTVLAQPANIGGIDYWKLTLAAPTVTGSVLDKNGQPIANSWISPYDQINNIWMSGVNSRTTGAFSMALKDGTYRIEANVPWGITNTAKSAQCSITLLSGAVTTGGACVQSDKSIQLRLRAPNVTFTLKSGTDVMAYANINVGYGSWNTWAQSDADGKVALFIDPVAIAVANPSATGSISPYFWIDPPWNANNKMVRWDCQVGAAKPICSQLPAVTIGNEYPAQNLGDIQVLKPNTVLSVKVPGTSTSIGANAWVNLISFGLNGANQTWAGANTDSAGNAYFYLDTSTATADTRWGVTINPPWDKRQEYSVKEYGTYQEYGDWNHGLTWESLTTTTYSPATPNFSITVNRPTGGIANRYGWVQLDEIDSNGNQVSWKNGTSLDYSGRSSLLLAAGKRYRLTAYPNGGEGARTMCEVSTNSSNPIGFTLVSGKCAAGTLTSSSLVIVLDQGNVTGTVKDSANAVVVGAIVAAVATDATTLTTTTNEAGRFGLDLDLTKSWTITVIPSGTTLANKTLTTAVTTAGEVPTIVLANR